MLGIFASLTRPLQRVVQATFQSNFHTICQPSAISSLAKVDTFSITCIRTKVRCYFPRPNEVRRVRRHGWEHRMSTPNGRKIIMRRILAGRYVLSH